MGHQASADIFFGLFLGEDGIWHNDRDYTALPWGSGEETFESAVARVAGFAPSDEDYWEKQREAVENCPLKEVWSGYKWSAKALAVRRTHFNVDWNDNPFNLTPEKMGVEPAWIAELEEWCAKLGLPADKLKAANPDGPRWICLVGYG